MTELTGFYWPSVEVSSISSTYILLARTLPYENSIRPAEKYSPVMCLRKKWRMDFEEQLAGTDLIKPE